MVIPFQDPVLFIGSLRKNLDPFDEFDEDKLWTALELVGVVIIVIIIPFQQAIIPRLN